MYFFTILLLGIGVWGALMHNQKISNTVKKKKVAILEVCK